VGIGSTASLLLDEIDPSDARRADLELILNETRRLDRIVNQIINYARPRALTPTIFSVPELIEDALKLFEASFVQKKIRVTRVFEPNLPHLEADRDQIKQVFLNLLQNALEATPKDGVVSLSASKSDSDGQPGLIISVVDTGVGIAPDDLAHVFEPFFTTGKHQGTGLGLAICRNIIDAHSGDVTLTSRVSAGTTVRVRLPLRQRPQMRI